jgi:putative transposase
MAIEWLDKTSLTFLTGENLSEQCSMMGTGRPDKARRKRSFALSVTHINKALRA